MRPWKEVIAEARDRNKEKAEQERRKKIAKTALKGSAALKQEKKGSKKTGPSPEYLELAQQREKRKAAQFSWTKERAEKNKAEQLKKLKERESASHKERAKQAIADIKPERISSKEGEASAYTKVVGNVGSLAGGLTKAAIHGARYAASKRKEKADDSKETKIPEKKERKSGILGGRPSRPKPTASPSAAASSASASSAPEPKKLVPATKRLQPAGGLAQGRPKAKTLGQRARQNPKIRAGLIAQRMEEFSNWREEFIVEVEGEKSKEKKEKIVDVMRGKNKIEINPNIKEERDEEGGMAHNELATVERAVKSLRKKIKSPNQQLPAWVQSKISKAADYIDTVADYMMGETEKVTEAYDDETFRQHSRETFSSHAPSESRARTASVLKKMKEINVNVEKSKKKKKKKTVAEECGCMDDKKKVLATAILKKH